MPARWPATQPLANKAMSEETPSQITAPIPKAAAPGVAPCSGSTVLMPIPVPSNPSAMPITKSRIAPAKTAAQESWAALSSFEER